MVEELNQIPLIRNSVLCGRAKANERDKRGREMKKRHLRGVIEGGVVARVREIDAGKRSPAKELRVAALSK